MNETEYLRAQLALERAHLREILQAVRGANRAAATARPIAAYLDWAGRRLVRQLDAQRQVSLAAPPPDDPDSAPADLGTERLLALLAAWSDPPDALTGGALRATQWRKVAQLSADTILQERLLYTAARAAAGLS